MSNILHLEDDRHDAELVDELLRDAGFECTIRIVESRAEFVSAIAKGGIDLIIADYSLPSFDGMSALKIDRSFIIRMTKDPDNMTIVSTIISLAHSLNLKVIAEGVDSEAQAKLLGLLKCDEMQGYLFSKPLPANELTAFVKVH